MKFLRVQNLWKIRISKEFYEYFWDEITKLFLVSIHKAFLNQEFSTSQKEAASKMFEKKIKIRHLLRTGGRCHCIIQI